MIYQIFGIIVAFFGAVITFVMIKLVVWYWKENDAGDRISAILMSWFIIMGILIFFAGVAMTMGEVHSAEAVQELNKDCVEFSDGKTAIVRTEGGITGDFKFIWCDGSDVAWFLSKGYHIVAEQSSLGPIDKVYLTR